MNKLCLIVPAIITLLFFTSNNVVFAEITKEEGLGGIQSYSARPHASIIHPGMEAPPSSDIDERALWRLYAERRYDELEALMAQYRELYPGWQPPIELLIAMVQVRLSENVKSVQEGKTWKRLIQLYEAFPNEFVCDKIHNMWALGEAYHATDRASDLVSLYQRILKECSVAKFRLVTLQRATHQLSRPTMLRLIKQEEARLLTGPEGRAFGKFVGGFYSTWLASAIRSDAAAEIEGQLIPYVLAERHLSSANQLGWWALNKGRFDDANAWFSRGMSWEQNGESAYGRAVTHLKAGRREHAKALAKEWLAREPRMARLLMELQTADVDRLYRQADYKNSLQRARYLLSDQHIMRNATAVRSLKTVKAWSLYHLDQNLQAARVFESLYKTKPDQEIAKGLVLSYMRLEDYQRILQIAEDTQGPLDEFIRPGTGASQEIRNIHYGFSTARMTGAHKRGNHVTAKGIAAGIADQIITRRDHDLAEIYAWSALQTGDLRTAEPWFQRAMDWRASVDAAHGLALTKRARGDLAGADRLAKEWECESPQLRLLRRDIALDRANDAYQTDDYKESLRLAKHSTRFAGSRRSDMLSAWSHYQLGQTLAARQIFEALYRDKQEPESADGLIASSMTLNEERRLQAVASEIGGVVWEKLSPQLTRRYLDRDLFILADQTRGNTHPQLKNIHSPSIAVMEYGRHRSGEQGLGQMDTIGGVFQGRAGLGLHRFALDIGLLYLNSGQPEASALLGSLGTQRVAQATDETGMLVEPRLSYRYDSVIAPHFSIGGSPGGGEVGPALVGDVGIEYRRAKTNINVEFFAENIQQSILSTSGIVDPFTGQPWGRVIEYGVRGNLWRNVHGPWGLAINGLYGHLDGKHVADNDHIRFGVNLGYSLPLTGFDYFVIGPAYRYEHFSDNRSFFTFGHGGYFSPDALHGFDASLVFQTDEARQFVVRGRTSLGYQTTDEDHSNAFPLTGTGPLLRGGDESGVAFLANLAGVYRLGDQFHIGGFVNAIQTSNFTDFGLGIVFRYVFEPRPAVFSSDLPDVPWTQ